MNSPVFNKLLSVFLAGALVSPLLTAQASEASDTLSVTLGEMALSCMDAPENARALG